MEEGINYPRNSASDRVCKLFRVLTGGTRQRLICEQTFTLHSAAQHSQLPAGRIDGFDRRGTSFH
jgi:hypothetical protein